MPKRKRSSASPSAVQPLNSLARQKNLCTQCLAAASKPLLAALRLGATFERQKHSRRKKTAQSKNDKKVLERLDVEYSVLKTLDLEKVAGQHLRKTVGRVKSLKDAEALQDFINEGSIGGGEKGYEGRSLSKDLSTLNVLARLCKTPAVRKAMDEVIGDLKSIVAAAEGAAKHQDGAEDLVQDFRTSKPGETENANVSDGTDEADDPYSIFGARIAEPSSAEEDSADSLMDEDRPPSVGGSESEHDLDDDLEAQSENSGSSFNGFTDDNDEGARLFPLIATPSDNSSDSDLESTPESPAHIIQPSLKHVKDIPTVSSAFIPALSHAAYISGSESEASDLDMDIAPKKNRRGQRARQKIAEAKFGAKAKHLDKVERNKGWDAKRGAVANDRRGQRGRGTEKRGPLPSGGNAEPLGEKKGGGAKRDDKGELHPSWQAAKAVRESKKLKINVKGGRAPGKKIIFD